MAKRKIQESEEVKKEGRLRAEAEAIRQKQIDEIESADKKRQEQMREEHNQRVDDAHAFDWDAWEEETGLERPEIPDKR